MAPEKPVESPYTELNTFFEGLKSMISEIDGKIRWCNMIITDDFDSEKLNLARALYEYQVQTHIQDDLLKKQKKLDALKRKVSIEIPRKSEVVLKSRDDTKREAEEILTYFKEKDLDKSKNKRKPISFRRSFI